MKTLDMLLEMKTSRLSTVQYCHACPNSSLLAVALSHYTVEVQHNTVKMYVNYSVDSIYKHILPLHLTLGKHFCFHMMVLCPKDQHF